METEDRLDSVAYFPHYLAGMKAVNKVLRISAVFMIALTILVSGVKGLVLCIRADGHVAIEIAHEGHCGDAHETHEHGEHHEPTRLVGTDSQCCPPCVDVPLSTDTMSQPVAVT